MLNFNIHIFEQSGHYSHGAISWALLQIHCKVTFIKSSEKSDLNILATTRKVTWCHFLDMSPNSLQSYFHQKF